MMATVRPTLPVGPGWSYEVKWDGYRALLVKQQGRVAIVSRNLNTLTASYPEVASAARGLAPQDFVVDGELVALDEQGRPSFQALQHRSLQPHRIVYYAFDLLRLGDTDYRARPLATRRAALEQLGFAPPIFRSDPLPGSAREIEAAVRQAGLEGVVAKRLDSPYESGKRTETWIKVRFRQAQEFVVGGYKPDGSGFDSILVGYYERRKLYFAGKVRAGFTAHARRELFERIRGSGRDACPFANLPNSAGRTHWGEGITPEEMLELAWVRPRVVIVVAFTEWTSGGNLRHASFVGIREDKPARDVHRSA